MPLQWRGKWNTNRLNHLLKVTPSLVAKANSNTWSPDPQNMFICTSALSQNDLCSFKLWRYDYLQEVGDSTRNTGGVSKKRTQWITSADCCIRERVEEEEQAKNTQGGIQRMGPHWGACPRFTGAPTQQEAVRGRQAPPPERQHVNAMSSRRSYFL